MNLFELLWRQFDPASKNDDQVGFIQGFKAGQSFTFVFSECPRAHNIVVGLEIFWSSTKTLRVIFCRGGKEAYLQRRGGRAAD